MINIHNGDAMATTARRIGLPGEHLPFREALVTGPAPQSGDWLAARAAFLASNSGEELLRMSNSLFEQEQAINAAYDSDDEVVFWFEHDLFCLVNFLYLLERFRGRRKAVSFVWCSGMLTERDPNELLRLSNSRAPVTPSMFKLAAHAWGAYTSPDPRLLLDVIAAPANEMPFLRDGFRLHASRFPSTRNGLGSVENRLLSLIAAGARDFAVLFPQFDEKPPRYGFGDLQVLTALRSLASRGVPLITTVEIAGAPPRITFTITPAGENVMNGAVNDLTVNDPDYWIGGVHLTKENIWRWDEERGEIIPNRPAAS
ncbi:MAG TPA: hypothetical protein VLU46_02070 [Thermoanaerobaculia bacterium]|nr:hypothetical protein [Thermoanaerobaculia bacterium]